MLRPCGSLHVLVEVDAQEDSEEAQQVHLEREAEGRFDEDQVQGQRRVNARFERAREDVLNRTGGGHHAENLSQNSSQQSPHEDKNQQDQR